MNPKASFAVALTLLLPAVLAAQTIASDYYSYPASYHDLGSVRNDTRQLTFSRLPGVSMDYKIGPGDGLIVTVVELPELSGNYTVSNAGVLTMPLIGAINIAEKTAEEIELLIAERLKERQLLRRPEVLVDVTHYVAKRIYILGEVDKAGEYSMSQQLTLMDAILIAGGLDISADRYGYLHRRVTETGSPDDPASVAGNPQYARTFNVLSRVTGSPLAGMARPDAPEPGTVVFRIDLTPLKRGGVLEEDIPLRPNDVFIVPRRNEESVYVIGEVRRPGFYDIRPGEKLTVSRAIAQAGGPAETAHLKKGILVRRDSTGQRVERKVDFSGIIKGKQPDFEVLPNDIIFLPGSTVRTLGYGLLGTVPGTVQMSIPAGAVRGATR
ncbi:MAG: polysaccharide export protein [Bryobacterales bacterium]|nr:polysaccharide export protein [Bryobacterales bacterium]